MGNLSQIRRAEMLEYLNHLKEIHTDDESRIALGKIETALTEKKYGLVWEEHEEEVDKKLVHNIPVFREVEDKKILADENAGFNFLLEGDNLHSLKLLEKTHKGEIDVIYIDPPYNTKNKEFIYNDTKIGEDDTYRHSKWISFMNERLLLAKKLLSDEGVIFISIDDNEVAQLKLLCDSIFGEQNFIANICRQAIKGGSRSDNIKTVHDYVLIYAKSKNDMNPFTGLEKEDIEYPYEDGKGPYAIGRELNKWGAGSRREDSPTMWFPISGPNGEEVYPIRNDGSEGRWRWGKNKLLKAVEQGEVVFNQRDNGTYIVYEKIRELKNNTTYFNTWFENNYVNAKGSEAIKKIFNTMMSIFDYSKPVELIFILCFMVNNKNAIILDFFAGSGTTGQAVMELNKEDGGNRNFILCTNNENNICEDITYERLSRVIRGYEFSGKIKDELKSYNLNISNLKKIDSIFQEFERIKSEKKDDYNKFSIQSKDGVLKLIGEKEILDKVAGIPNNLKYYKTEFIPKLSEDEEILSSKLLNYIKEMVELENMCEIDGNSRRIILSDEDLNIALSEIEEGGILYIPSFILLTNEIKDSIEERKLEVVTIPDYYFTEELREVNEL